MAKIFSPNKQYSGISAGVTFVNGQAETEDKRLIAWFQSKGYGIDAPVKADSVPAADTTKDAEAPVWTKEELEALKRDDLIEVAKKYELEQPHKTKSEEIVAAIAGQVKK